MIQKLKCFCKCHYISVFASGIIHGLLEFIDMARRYYSFVFSACYDAM